MEENKDNIKQINVIDIVKAMYKCKKLYFYALPITFVIACLIIICVPRYYSTTVKLAPELSSYNSSSLTDIAASFGFDFGASSNSGDAIFPELYPDLISSNDFLTSLFDVQIKSKDNSISTTYYNYLSTQQKSPWWSTIMYKIRQLFEEKDTMSGKQKGVNPFMLTKRQDNIVKLMSDKIKCNVDKKNYVISITVEDQDPLICATMADTVKVRLQQFITEYRTSKARNDYKYMLELCENAKKKYEELRRTYGSYADANQELSLESYKLKLTDLENEMQLQYNSYSTISTQLQQAQARVLEKTPAFTTLQSASVPLKPAGPKRMIFVIGMTFLAFIVVSVYAVRDLLISK